jgi:ABC-type transport system involved in cytochrome c biogenesis permease subunit
MGFILTLSLFAAVLMYQRKGSYGTIVRRLSIGTWAMGLLGLITGMIWAQIAWGRYWSFDPKETMTLLYFITMGCLAYASQKRYPRRRLLHLSVLAVVLMVLTVIVPFVLRSLHTF